MEQVGIALLIFGLRICDVSIGTVRVIYTIRGNRVVSAALGFVESAVWIFAISRAMKYVEHPLSMIGWAAGFAAGAVLGITLERWIATGHIMMRVISLLPAHLPRTRHPQHFPKSAQQHRGVEQITGKRLLRPRQAFARQRGVCRAIEWVPIMSFPH